MGSIILMGLAHVDASVVVLANWCANSADLPCCENSANEEI